MPLRLDRTQRRIVGCLLEKEATVPDAYPLTVNSLLLACNQSSNRDPVMHLAEHEVVGALRALMQQGWAVELELAGSRTRRYGHLAKEQLGVDAADLAILAELLLRGPQSPQELHRRASRMRALASPEEVERRLGALSARPVPYVRFLGRRPGERVPRWDHTLYPEGEAREPSSPATEPESAAARPMSSDARPGATPQPASDPAEMAELVARVEALEREVASLKARLDG